MQTCHNPAPRLLFHVLLNCVLIFLICGVGLYDYAVYVGGVVRCFVHVDVDVVFELDVCVY